MVLGKLDWYMQKNETRPPTYTIHKNKLKIDKILKRESWNHKNPRRGFCWVLPRNPSLPRTTKRRITTTLKTINNQKSQKIKLHGSPSTKELNIHQTGRRDRDRQPGEQRGPSARRRIRRVRRGWLNEKLKTQASCKLPWEMPWWEKLPVSHDRICWKVGLEPSKQATLFPLWPLPHGQHHNTVTWVASLGWIPKVLPPYNITGAPRKEIWPKWKNRSKLQEKH